MKWLSLALLLAFPASAAAHNVQCDGTVVPQWVKESCCGKADYHLIPYTAVSEDGKGNYLVEVFDPLQNKNRILKVPEERALPSPDGCTSIFFANGADDPAIYCFFFNPSI